jgi:hypothetical protein
MASSALMAHVAFGIALCTARLQYQCETTPRKLANAGGVRAARNVLDAS